MAKRADLSRIGAEIKRQSKLLRGVAKKLPRGNAARQKLSLTIQKLDSVYQVVQNSCSMPPMLRWKGPDPNRIIAGSVATRPARRR